MKRLFFLITFVLAGCTTMSVEQYSGQGPALNIEDYFLGQTRAWGMFQDRSGRVQREFTVDITGTMDGETLILDEDFVYADGETDRRVWHIRRIDAHRYEGRANDVIGVARGTVHGNTLNWVYVLDLPYKDGSVKVKFDDWMFLQPDGVLINRATMSKFGIRLGEVTLVFKKH